MEQDRIQTALRSVQRRLIDLSRSRGADLSPWFEANSLKVTLLGRILASIAAGNPADTPEGILVKARLLVEQKLNTQSEWFTKNLPLLRLVAKELLQPSAEMTTKEEPAPLFEALQLPDDFEAAAATMLGKEGEISAYLDRLGLDTESASLLARMNDLDDMRSEISRQFQDQIRRQNTALRAYASEASRATSRADLLTAALPDGPPDALAKAIEQSLAKAAAESVGAVAGLVAYLRAKKPLSEAAIVKVATPLGQLSRNWNTRILPSGSKRNLAEVKETLADEMLAATVEPSAEEPGLEKAAAEVNRINEKDSQHSPSTIVFGLPQGLEDSASKGSNRFAPALQAVDAALKKQSEFSAEAVAGLVVFARRYRPEVSDALSELAKPFGRLDESGESVIFPGGGRLVLKHIDRSHANIAVGVSLAERLRIAQKQPFRAEHIGTLLLGLEVAKHLLLVERSSDLESEATDKRTIAERTRANIDAINLIVSLTAKGVVPTAEELEKLSLYSGWGGLSIQAVQDRVPEGWLPEGRGLIHEYYTPSLVARSIASALRPFLRELKAEDGSLVALEPSAGIGRFIRAMRGDGYDGLKWSAVEYSKVSARLLQLLRPDIEVYQGPFEEWVQKNSDRMATFGLVVSNPPYGERGKAATLDRDPAYRYRQAYFYQMRRSCEFLREGGLGCFIVPMGFLTGKSPELIGHRREILLSNHLVAAFRLPSETEAGKSLFPGALLVVDAIFLRSRGGSLSEVVAEDVPILEGNYYAENPGFILGREVGKPGDDDEVSKKPRFGYQVVGTFDGFPAFVERPLCRDCTVIRPIRPEAPQEEPTAEVAEHLTDALKLARRSSSYLSLVAAGDEVSLRRAADLQPDLSFSLLAWNQEPTARKASVAAAVKQLPELATLYSVFKGGNLIPQIAEAPPYKPRYSGDASDIGAIGRYLYGQNRGLTIESVAEFIQSLGAAAPDKAALKSGLAAADFAFAGGGNSVVPPEVYYTGDLWPRFDEAKAAAEAGDPLAATQAARILKLISPATFAEIQAEPRMGWIPVAVLGAFINHTLKSTAGDAADYSYTRVGGFLTLEGVEYLDLALRATESQLLLIGYINHDMQYFKPRKGRSDDDTEERRVKMAEHISRVFSEWIETRPDMQALVTEAFNRRFRGWRTPSYPSDNLVLARWNDQKPLFWYQNSGVRRLAANHGGGLFFAVGLGKTRTILATVALARQQGWAKRPLIVVPNSVVYNWVKEISVVLPDYSIGIIGSKTRRLLRGDRKGELESETDSPAERSAKWQRFKAGLYDICILTYSSLARTRMREDTLLQIIRTSTAMSREIGFRVRALEERITYLLKLKKRDEEQQKELEALAARFAKMKPTERRVAIQSEKEEQFVADLTNLPEGQEHDPGITWDELGIDWLGFDEAHNGKNLFTAGSREGGTPKFLGSPQQASNLALQMFFRSAIVRRSTGGSGIYLADATPAKNSPLEFLSLTSFIDEHVWGRWGVADAEQFLSQYLKIEWRNIIGTDLEPEKAPCVVGFRNLDQFREVLFRYGEFRDAKEVGLKIPAPKSAQLEVALDDAQEEKYQRYLAQYEAALKKSAFDQGSKFVALALLQRMSLVAVHAELDEAPAPQGNPLLATKQPKKPQWTFKNASLAESYSSPKIDITARTIAQRKDCGHLVFAENNAVHFWLRERLVDFGIARERIGILNGETTPSNLARQRVAEGFTSYDSPLYDVVIGNKIAYEGINLQGRTCTIFHLDLPWEPATLTQRNGRGQRQGNRNEVINIYYVLAKASMDMARFQLIQGKREWMGAVLDSLATETNNPGAQQDMSPEDWLMWLSRDPEKTRQLIAQQKAKVKKDEDDKTRKLAWAGIRSIAVRHRDLRNADQLTIARLREDIEAIGADLEKIDGDVWSWKFIIPEVVRNPTLSFAPASDGAVWQTAKYKRKNHADKVIDTADFGRVLYEPRLGISYREEDSVYWNELDLSQAAQKWANTSPADWQMDWDPLLPSVEKSMEEFLGQLSRAPWHFREPRFDLAHEAFVVAIWDRYGKRIVETIVSSEYLFQVRLPILKAGILTAGEEDAKTADEVIAFTDAGFQRFLMSAQLSDLKWTEVEAIAQWWWNRSIPRNLLTLRDQKRKAETRGAIDAENEENAQAS